MGRKLPRRRTSAAATAMSTKTKKLKSGKNENSRKLTAALRSATAPTVPPRRWRTSRSDASRPKKSRFLTKGCATTRTRTSTPGARRPTRIWSWRRGKDSEAKRPRRRGEATAGVPSTSEWIRSDLIMIVTKQLVYYTYEEQNNCMYKMRSNYVFGAEVMLILKSTYLLFLFSFIFMISPTCKFVNRYLMNAQ